MTFILYLFLARMKLTSKVKGHFVTLIEVSIHLITSMVHEVH